MLKSIVSAVLLATVLGLGCSSSDPDADCKAVCDRARECRGEAAQDPATCTAECRALAKDDAAYADGLAAEAECYADATCVEITSGSCTGAGAD